MATESVSEAIRRAVELSFPPEACPAVLAALAEVWQWGPKYVRRAIVVLSYGDRGRLEQLVALAGVDARDVLLSLEEPPAGVTRTDLA